MYYCAWECPTSISFMCRIKSNASNHNTLADGELENCKKPWVKMPKSKGSASKTTQPECDLCGETVCSASQDSVRSANSVCTGTVWVWPGVTIMSCVWSLHLLSVWFLLSAVRGQLFNRSKMKWRPLGLNLISYKKLVLGDLGHPQLTKQHWTLKEDMQQLKSSIYSYLSRHAKPSNARKNPLHLF